METFYVFLALCEGINRSPMNSPHKGQWRGALMYYWDVEMFLMFSSKRHRAHYDVTLKIVFIYLMLYHINFYRDNIRWTNMEKVYDVGHQTDT